MFLLQPHFLYRRHQNNPRCVWWERNAVTIVWQWQRWGVASFPFPLILNFWSGEVGSNLKAQLSI